MRADRLRRGTRPSLAADLQQRRERLMAVRTRQGDQSVGAAHPSPVVDVGISTLGTSRYLVEAIESVLSQSLSEWSLVVSENGPGLTDVRRAMEPFLEDKRVRHVVTGTRLGRGAHYTRLIRAGR